MSSSFDLSDNQAVDSVIIRCVHDGASDDRAAICSHHQLLVKDVGLPPLSHVSMSPVYYFSPTGFSCHVLNFYAYHLVMRIMKNIMLYNVLVYLYCKFSLLIEHTLWTKYSNRTFV